MHDPSQEIAENIQLVVVERRELLTHDATHDWLAKLEEVLAVLAQSVGRCPALPLLADDKPAIDEAPGDRAEGLIGLEGRLGERMGRGSRMGGDSPEDD